MDQLKAFASKLKDLGLPLIWVYDPVKKGPSVSLTLLILSFLLTFAGIVGKVGNVIDINVDQSKELLYAMSFLYFGRSLTNKNANTVVEATKKEE